MNVNVCELIAVKTASSYGCRQGRTDLGASGSTSEIREGGCLFLRAASVSKAELRL